MIYVSFLLIINKLLINYLDIIIYIIIMEYYIFINIFFIIINSLFILFLYYYYNKKEKKTNIKKIRLNLQDFPPPFPNTWYFIEFS